MCMEKLATELRKAPRPIVLGSFLHGSGRSTLADLLARELERLGLDIERISSGDVFRELAREKGKSIDEFIKEITSENSLEVDLEIDKKIKKRIEQALENGKIPIVDSNLAPFYAGGIRVLVKLDPSIAGKRVYEKKRGTDKTYSSPEEARDELEKRTRADLARYERLAREDWVPEDWKRIYREAVENWGNENYFHVIVDNSGSLDESFGKLVKGLCRALGLSE